MKTITEVRTFVVMMHCDCGGEVIFNGHANLAYPPQYVHMCRLCGKKYVYPEQYPMNTTQKVGEPTEIPDE